MKLKTVKNNYFKAPTKTKLLKINFQYKFELVRQKQDVEFFDGRGGYDRTVIPMQTFDMGNYNTITEVFAKLKELTWKRPIKEDFTLKNLRGLYNDYIDKNVENYDIVIDDETIEMVEQKFKKANTVTIKNPVAVCYTPNARKNFKYDLYTGMRIKKVQIK